MPRQLHFSQDENDSINFELQLFLKKGVIQLSSHEPGEFISNIFPRPKKNNRSRIILDLSVLNLEVTYIHFKMESIHTAAALMMKGCFMGSVDLSDAYYTIPIRQEDRKLLKFIWENKLYQYTCLPNGLAQAPRNFTRILKPVFAYLATKGVIAFGYIDDTFVMGCSFQECERGILLLKDILERLGFFINVEKSVFTPATKIEFLGFILDSENMTIVPTQNKKEKTITMISSLLAQRRPKIRQVAKVVGTCISNTVGSDYGGNYIKILEIDKIQALAKRRGNYDAHMTISDRAKNDIHWWIINMDSTLRHIRQEPPSVEILTDASNLGWGATYNGKSAQSTWSIKESAKHINVKELMGALFGLKSFFTHSKQLFINCRIDNTTAVSYINKQGGTKSWECLMVAKEIWSFCEERQIYVIATHIPGVMNEEADRLSRKFNEFTEWALPEKVFRDITHGLTIDIDLFATRLNHKCKKYVSWHADPGAWKIDAFSFKWSKYFTYVFPPFALIARVVTKMECEAAKGMLVTPTWTTQPWWGLLIQLHKPRKDLGQVSLRNDVTGEPWTIPLSVWQM